MCIYYLIEFSFYKVVIEKKNAFYLFLMLIVLSFVNLICEKLELRLDLK